MQNIKSEDATPIFHVSSFSIPDGHAELVADRDEREHVGTSR
jgi:hypothetical protein